VPLICSQQLLSTGRRFGPVLGPLRPRVWGLRQRNTHVHCAVAPVGGGGRARRV